TSRKFLSDDPTREQLTGDKAGFAQIRGGTREVFGIPVSDELMRQAMAISRGANRALPDGVFSAADYWDRHPLRSFTYEENLLYTEAFGVGFAGQLYRLYLETQERNERFRDEILDGAARLE